MLFLLLLLFLLSAAPSISGLFAAASPAAVSGASPAA
jgi:hypothetical protein